MPQKPLSDLDAWLAQDAVGPNRKLVEPVDTSDLDSFLATEPGGKGVGIGTLDEANKPKERSWLDSIIDALPSLGGTAGGIIGGIGGTVSSLPILGVGGVPGAVGGAALGAAGGEGFKQVANFLRGEKSPTTITEAVHEMGVEGGKNAAFELAGHGLAKGVLGPVARAVTKKAFHPTSEMIKETPSLTQDIMDYGIGHSQRGLDKAKAITTASRQAADDAILVAEQNGLRVPRSELLDATVVNPYGHKSAFDLVSAGAEKTPGLTQLGNSWDNVIRDNAPMLTPTEMQVIKRREGELADSVFSGAGDPSIGKQIHADYMSGARNSLETRIPGLGAQNAETQKRLMTLQAVQRALKLNESKPMTADALAKMVTIKTLLGGAGTLVGGPGGGVAAVAAHQVLKQPRVLAAGARGLNQVSKHPEILANAIRGVSGIVTEESAESKRRREIEAFLKANGR